MIKIYEEMVLDRLSSRVVVAAHVSDDRALCCTRVISFVVAADPGRRIELVLEPYEAQAIKEGLTRAMDAFHNQMADEASDADQ